ncbi:MAG: 4Fe-4S binding protein [Actinobacteria bacterium]|nr:4Fe-4S binding protein [Actinomycetota bacterium]MBU1942947.1 4Fe-4S binding protein [Actinomycetota bacterium]MBU2687327.1 4Fe-4S binding protein [Actinomycetota bacterium]
MKTEEFAGLVHKVVPSRDFMSVDAGECTGCADCVIVCPVFLWKVREGRAVLAADYRERCLECGACWQVCSSGAIRFDFPDSGTGIVVRYG